MFIILFVGFFKQAKAQGPVAPSNGIWALIDTNYTVGTNTQGYTDAKITLRNTTLTKYTAVQFRVYYDIAAFSGATVSLIGSTTNLDLQYNTNTTSGFITVTLVYTGGSSTYTLSEGERFLIRFNHVSESTFNMLTSIGTLKFATVPATNVYPQYAAKQDGMDTTLNLYSYGGNFILQKLKFHGSFVNTNGTPAKNLPLSLERKPYNGSTWVQHSAYTTDNNGKFNILVNIDTNYWDVRLSIKGDTMSVGNIISTTDAQLINQWVLGTATPSGFDYYTADVNGSNNITISDAYGVFGRIAGRFTQWPNSVKDVKFFTPTEYATINGSSTNYTSTISGTTNFYHNILAGQADSIVRYVLAPGDANNTGYHMARITPIEVVVGPSPGLESQIYNVIDQSVEYDFPTNKIEVNVPKISVNSGNLVNIPVKVLTNGSELNSLQFGLKYNDTILEFKNVYSSSNAMEWLTYINPNGGEIDWGGYDVTNNQHTLKNGDEVITLQFLALVPQNDWNESPLYTTRKFAGDASSKDLTITPTNGVLQVLKMKGSGKIISPNTMEIYPNPFDNEITITFRVTETTDAELVIYDLLGRKMASIVNGIIPEGQFSYNANLGNLAPGMYIATLNMEKNSPIFKKITKEK